MNGLSSLPIVACAADQMSFGINASHGGPAGETSAVHPVQLIERHRPRQEDANQKNILSRIYGSHMPMKLHMEQVRESARGTACTGWRAAHVERRGSLALQRVAPSHDSNALRRPCSAAE
jgi:hypothetical protein